MNKIASKFFLSLLIAMLTVLPCGFIAPAFGEPRPIDRQMFDKLVAAESLDSDFDYILEKYCSTDESWKRRRIMIDNLAEEKPLKVAEDLYIFFAADKGYLFDDFGYKYFLSLGKTQNESALVTGQIRVACGIAMIIFLLSFAITVVSAAADYHNQYKECKGYKITYTFCFMAFIVFFLVSLITVFYDGEDAESRCNNISINSVSIGSLDRIRKLRNTRDLQLGKPSVPGKEVLITSGDETEKAMIEVTRSAPGNYHSEVKEVVVEKKVPGEVKAMAEALIKAGYAVEVNASGDITLKSKDR